MREITRNFGRTVFGAGLVLLTMAAVAAAGAAPAAAPDYRGATAHGPHFDDAALWGDCDVKRAAYARQQWPKGRLYVWAHPGKSGGKRFRGAMKAVDPKNWLLDGKPADELVLDEHTDLLFPASETPYRVGFRGTDVLEVCRHVTVESGAGFVGGGDGRGRTIYGNVWVKAGGTMYAQGATKIVGTRHTFFRNDNVAGAEDDRRNGRHRCSQYFTFDKGGVGSVEFLGHVTVSDEFRLHRCLVIVGRDSILQPGRHAAPTIYQGGTLALLDGAYFGKWCNDFGIPDMTVEGGTIQGGLPGRPLTRDCRFGLAFKNFTNATWEGLSEEQHRESRRVPSLLVKEGGTLRTIPAEGSDARLVFTVAPDGVGDRSSFDLRPVPGSEREAKVLKRHPDAAERFRWFDTLPRGLDVFLGKGVVVDRVRFEHLRRGGVLCPDPAALRAAWTDVTFGPNCAASGDDLFTQRDGVDRNGRY